MMKGCKRTGIDPYVGTHNQEPILPLDVSSGFKAYIGICLRLHVVGRIWGFGGFGVYN